MISIALSTKCRERYSTCIAIRYWQHMRLSRVLSSIRGVTHAWKIVHLYEERNDPGNRLRICRRIILCLHRVLTSSFFGFFVFFLFFFTRRNDNDYYVHENIFVPCVLYWRSKVRNSNNGSYSSEMQFFLSRTWCWFDCSNHEKCHLLKLRRSHSKECNVSKKTGYSTTDVQCRKFISIIPD